MTLRRLFYAGILVFTLISIVAGCTKNQDFLQTQRTAFVNYLTSHNLNYTNSGGVYRYVANATRPGYDTCRVVQAGDSVIFNFAAYTYGSPLGKLYLTNVKTWIGTTDVINTEYWDLTPKRIKWGETSMISGLQNGLAGSKMKDSMLLFITSDLCYGSDRVGVIPANAPTVWIVKVLDVK